MRQRRGRAQLELAAVLAWPALLRVHALKRAGASEALT
jgi:hypothetical protein